LKGHLLLGLTDDIRTTDELFNYQASFILI